jgi:hypothetical protein
LKRRKNPYLNSKVPSSQSGKEKINYRLVSVYLTGGSNVIKEEKKTQGIP